IGLARIACNRPPRQAGLLPQLHGDGAPPRGRAGWPRACPVCNLPRQPWQRVGQQMAQNGPGAHHRAIPHFACLGAVLGGAFALMAQDGANLAVVATPGGSYVSGDTSYAALNDGNTPQDSRERGPGSYGNWPRHGTNWVEYTWSQPICTARIEVYWWDDHRGV